MGQLDDALQLIEDQIKIDTLNERLFSKRGEILLAKGMHRDAYDNFNIALEMHPGYAEGYFQRGIFFYTVGEPQLAVMDFNDAMFFAKSDTLKHAALLNRGNALFMAGSKEKALRDFDSLATMYPDDITYKNNVAATQSALGNHEDAVKLYDEIIQENRAYVKAYANLGFEYIQLKEFKKAKRVLRKGLKKDNKLPTLWSNLALAYYHLDKPAKALDIINCSILLNKNNAYAYRNKALILQKLGDPKAMCESLDKALSLDYTYIYGDDVEKLKQEHCVQQ